VPGCYLEYNRDPIQLHQGLKWWHYPATWWWNGLIEIYHQWSQRYRHKVLSDKISLTWMESFCPMSSCERSNTVCKLKLHSMYCAQNIVGLIWNCPLKIHFSNGN
jgi:hypothetical protein